MKIFFRELLIHILSFANIYPSKCTDISKLKALIAALHPYTTDKSLIRLGPDGDGGYLIPDDLEDIKACFSPGVSTVCGFEKRCAEMGMEVFMADKSIDKLPDSHENFHFIKKYIGAISNDDFITLDDWVKSVIPEGNDDLILQIDIEGYEYETFLAMSDTLLKRFRIIVIEFHMLNQLFSKSFFSVASSAFYKILQNHSVVHIHPNNIGFTTYKSGIEIQDCMEFTFLRNDRVMSKTKTDSFPHKLDFHNTNKSSLVLPRCWYQ